MSYKLETENTGALNLMAQMLEAANNSIVDFYNKRVQVDFNSKKITQSSYDHMTTLLQKKVETNSEFIEKIEKVLFARIKSKLVGCTVPSDFNRMLSVYEKLFEQDSKTLDFKTFDKTSKNVIKLDNGGNTKKSGAIQK